LDGGASPWFASGSAAALENIISSYESGKNIGRRFARTSADEALARVRAAVEHQSEETGKQRGEQDRPADAARPGAQHGDEALLDLVLIDCCVGVRHGVVSPLRWQRYKVKAGERPTIK
jgi:hypothetical protein